MGPEGLDCDLEVMEAYVDHVRALPGPGPGIPSLPAQGQWGDGLCKDMHPVPRRPSRSLPDLVEVRDSGRICPEFASEFATVVKDVVPLPSCEPMDSVLL